MTFEKIILAIIGLSAVGYIGYYLWRKTKNKIGCGCCNCSGNCSCENSSCNENSFEN